MRTKNIQIQQNPIYLARYHLNESLQRSGYICNYYSFFSLKVSFEIQFSEKVFGSVPFDTIWLIFNFKSDF